MAEDIPAIEVSTTRTIDKQGRVRLDICISGGAGIGYDDAIELVQNHIMKFEKTARKLKQVEVRCMRPSHQHFGGEAIGPIGLSASGSPEVREALGAVPSRTYPTTTSPSSRPDV